MNIHLLYANFLITLLFLSCDQLTNEKDSSFQQGEVSPIIQIADTIMGGYHQSYTFHISDYFQSEAPITYTELHSNELTIYSLPKDSFRVSQETDSAGYFVIHADLKNSDKQELKTKLTYKAAGTDSTPDHEKAEIIQTHSVIKGKQGTDLDVDLCDYFESDAALTSTALYSDEITIEQISETVFRLSQPADVYGEFLIEAVLSNSDQITLEAELNYQIEPNTTEPPVSSDEPLVIMPLGDSMTNDPRSRVQLWNLLESDGHEIDYVGDQRQNSSIPDPDHEGVGGITIQGIMNKAASLMQTHQPKYVALMVGTNDIAWYFDETGTEIAARWDMLIERIFESSEGGTFILAATIPPVSSKNVGKAGMPTRDRAVLVKEYNEALRARINEHKNRGNLIILADMESALDPQQHLSGDGVHLNEEGYAIMGSVYYEAMKKALNR